MSSGLHASRARHAARPAPVAAVLLCGALVGVYTWEIWIAWSEGPAELESLIHAFGLVPREFLDGRLFTPVTALFLHAGTLHLLANVGFLLGFGFAVEPSLGSRRFLILFAACGLAAGLLHVALAPSSFVPTVGASGAVSGVVGAWWRLPDPPGTSQARPGRTWALALLSLWIGAQLVAGLSSGAADAGWGHLGGFATGLLALPWLLPARGPAA